MCLVECIIILAVKEAGMLSLQLNVDGVQVFKSTSGQFWPVLGKIDKPFTGQPFVIGLFYGTSKPSSLEFLDDLCNEYTTLRENGILADGTVISLSISAVVCDAPARAFLKNIKGHTSYSACERCTEKGVWAGKMTFPVSKAAHRTDLSFLQMDDSEHHRGATPLANLGFGLVSTFVLDYMHLICLGVVRRLVWLWLCSPLELNRRLSARQVAEISDNLVILKPFIPKEFARKPRPLSEWQRWKATEFRQLLLYTGPVVFASKLPDVVYHNFLLLSVGIYLLLNTRSDGSFVDYAEELLVAFVNHYSALYGSNMLVYNVHNVVHLADDARKYGSLDSVSAFCFENFLGKLVKLVHKPCQPLQQVVRRLLERRALITDNVGCPSSLCDTVPRGEHHSGFVPPSLGLCRQFRCISVNGMYISCTTGDNCAAVDNDVAVIRNILEKDGTVFLVYQRFSRLEDFFTYPTQSSKIGIFLASELSSELFVGTLASFKVKNVMLPFRKGYVVYPLLNC